MFLTPFWSFKSLYLASPPYFPSKPQFRIIITTSTFAVPGNISTQHPFSTRYPFSCKITRSLAKLVGLHDTYTIRSTPKPIILINALIRCLFSMGPYGSIISNRRKICKDIKCRILCG